MLEEHSCINAVWQRYPAAYISGHHTKTMAIVQGDDELLEEPASLILLQAMSCQVSKQRGTRLQLRCRREQGNQS